MGHVNLKVVLGFATLAHKGQTRRYTGDPYMMHPIAVAGMVQDIGGTDEMIAAALLHDTIEDTAVTYSEIRSHFGLSIANLVNWLTDISTPSYGNRAARKALDRAHIANAPAEAHTIKLADLIDNTSTIVKYDPDFAKVYLAEKRLLLDVLTRGHPKLMEIARAQIHAA